MFADMLLVLFFVGLGTAIPVDPPEPPPKPEPVAKPEIVGMETKPVSLNIRVNADALISKNQTARKQARQAVADATRQLRKKDAQAALVLVFGGGETAVMGQQVASALYPELNPAAKSIFPKGTPYRSFWDGGLPYGDVRVEVFLFTTEKADSP
ncbi:hypothetical protein ncot_11775 [Nocardioides sp. JQ2195]|uniref:hypothetical protein n=1 Tax=Nocardioides sp. JQ2195 TaxID=2592334 RepID=UPI00143E39C9|nr:hypothetical protein [Nocardioides sp. JQ2195]QIX27202.1 hypothetical protein ncot_11775 [Nocardioides sp. JQ2195]